MVSNSRVCKRERGAERMAVAQSVRCLIKDRCLHFKLRPHIMKSSPLTFGESTLLAHLGVEAPQSKGTLQLQELKPTLKGIRVVRELLRQETIRL